MSNMTNTLIKLGSLYINPARIVSVNFYTDGDQISSADREYTLTASDFAARIWCDSNERKHNHVTLWDDEARAFRRVLESQGIFNVVDAGGEERIKGKREAIESPAAEMAY